MPTVDTNIDINIDVDIEVDEFLEACKDKEILQIIDYLIENDYLDAPQDKSKQTATEYYWNVTISKITENRLLLTDEELEFIEKIAKRF
jgi:hypothetical protein